MALAVFDRVPKTKPAGAADMANDTPSVEFADQLKPPRKPAGLVAAEQSLRKAREDLSAIGAQQRALLNDAEFRDVGGDLTRAGRATLADLTAQEEEAKQRVQALFGEREEQRRRAEPAYVAALRPGAEQARIALFDLLEDMERISSLLTECHDAALRSGLSVPTIIGHGPALSRAIYGVRAVLNRG